MDEFTTFAAVWGALLSTVVFIWQIQENRRRMKVKVAYSLAPSEYVGRANKFVSINGANISKRPISLSAYGLKMPDNRDLWFPNTSPDSFPTTLKDGEACTM